MQELDAEMTPIEANPDDDSQGVDTGPDGRRHGVLRLLWPYALVLLVGLIVLLPRMGEFGFWDPWEPKYAESAREMIEKDSYVVPYYRYNVRLTKPILVYWGIIAGARVFGLNEFGARIAGVSMALGAMLGVLYAVSLLRGRQAGILAAVVLGTAPHFFFISRQAMPDVYLFTSLGCCILFLALGLFGPDRRRNLHFIISYACFALAVLAKGPMIAGVICLATLAVYTAALVDLKLLWRRDVRAETLRFGLAVGAGVPALAALAYSSFLLGAPPIWWGYDGGQRRAAAVVRRQIIASSQRFHLAEILLVATGIGLAAIGAWWFLRARRDEATRRSKLVWPGIATLGAIAAWISLTRPELETRLFAASLLGALVTAVLLPLALWRLSRRPAIRERIQPYLKPIGLQIGLFAIVFIVVAGPWHVAIVLEQGHGYFTDFIIKHNIHRAVEKVNSTGVTDFYIRTLIFGYYPWSIFIPLALATLIGWGDKNPLKRYGFEFFLLIAATVTFVSFSSSTTKFPHYLAPMLVPLAVLIGLAVSKNLQRSDSGTARLAWLTAAMLYLLPMLDLSREGGVRYLVNSFTVKRFVPDELETAGYSLALLAAGLILLLLAAIGRSKILIAAFALVAVLMANYYTSHFIPELSKDKTLKYLVDSYRHHRMPGNPIGFHGDMKHGIFYYTSHEVELLGDVEEFMEFMDPRHKAFAVVERTKLFKLRLPYQNRYPGRQLYVVDDSHFAYHLAANFPPPGLDLESEP